MEEILHRIKVNLYENYLTDNPNDYSAKVISERTLNIKEICRMAVSRGGAPSTAEAMEHNVTLFLKEMAYQLMDGYSVNTGYYTISIYNLVLYIEIYHPLIQLYKLIINRLYIICKWYKI